MTNSPHQDLAQIRSMMEKSSRFISLSGLSGIFAGLLALASFFTAVWLMSNHGIHYFSDTQIVFTPGLLRELILLSIFTIIGALVLAWYFTNRKSKRQGIPMATGPALRLMVSLFVPLFCGGIFCIALLIHSQAGLIAPAMLIFYGLALINASKYTISDIEYLGYSELVLGLIALFFTGYRLLFWVAGFGILHIVYGFMMYKKYE